MLKAEIVLSDCKYALGKHTPNLQAEEFRLSWLTITVLLRAVGHVLDRVDSRTSDKHKTVIRTEWEKLNYDAPKPEIFHHFIKAERDRFLKEYDYGVRRQLTRNNKIGGIDSQVSVWTDNLQQARITKNESKDYFESFITSGYYVRRNEKEVANEAVSFWDKYIGNIKVLLNG